MPPIAVSIAAAVLSLAAAPAFAADEAKDVPPLWVEANTACRGGSGDKPETMAACARRDHFTNRLMRLGLCYGREGQIAAEHQWHPCGEGSNRPGR